MTILQRDMTGAVSPPPASVPRPWLRPLIGIVTAAVLLTAVTVLFTDLTGGLLMRSTVLLIFLGVVAVVTAVGGVRVAGGAAVASVLLVDYWFTRPLYTFNPLAPDMLVFIAATGVAIALTVFAARGFTRTPPANAEVDVTTAVHRTLRRLAGSTRWAAVYSTASGEMFAITAPGQDQADAAQQLADGVHGLTCTSCDRCLSPVA